MQSQDKSQGKAILAAVLQTAKADGKVTEEEQAWLDRLAQELQLDPEPPNPFRIESLAQHISNPTKKRELLQLLLLVAASDGRTTEDELAFIGKIASSLDIDEAELKRLARELPADDVNPLT